MHPTTRTWQSRDAWRRKAKDRNQSIRILEKRMVRRDKRIVHLEAKVNEANARSGELEAQLAEAKKATSAITLPQVVKLNMAAWIRALCVLLAVMAVVSFRSVPRIMAIFSASAGLALSWIPHFSSVINWTLRVGLAKLNAVAPIAEPWIAIVDASIDVSIKKALVVLRVKLSSLQAKGSALGLADCECIGIQVSATWNGEKVAEALAEVFRTAGKPTAILKDGGGDLSRGVRLWREENEARGVLVIDDVGHVAANALKAAYSKLQAFKNFLASIKSGGAKLRQSDIAFLTPPKVRTKGRFQSIMKVAEWGEKILTLLGGSGRQEEDSLADRLRGFLPGFGAHRPFIESFVKTTKIVSELLAIVKNRGLNQATFRECRLLLETLPERSKVRRRLMAWLTKHLHIHCRLGIGQMPLLVSSDVIESLFGKFKVTLQRNNKAEFNRVVLTIPALCGTLREADVMKLLSKVGHRELQAWEEKHVVDSQAKRRRLFLPTKRPEEVPKTVRPPPLKAA